MFSASEGQLDQDAVSSLPLTESGLSSHNVASFISHEFGNPVSAIKGFLDIVLDGRAGSLTPLQLEFLGLAQISANRLCGLIDDISDLRLIVGGNFRLELGDTRLGEVLARVVEQLRPLAASKEVSLGNLFPGEVPLCRLDAKRIERAIFNLVSHALKFASGGSRLSILGEALESRILLSISGMRSGALPLEYATIFKGTSSSHDLGQTSDATALGLTVTKYVVVRHGGEVWLDEQPGDGARICLSLPVGGCPREVG